MKFKIDWLVKKTPEWTIATLIQEDGSKLNEVSINKVNKKGEVFPNFDNLMPGQEVEGEFWTSDKDKNYLFAPKVGKTGNSGAFKQKMISDTMDRKETSISKFQDNKEMSIRLASAQRDAVLIVTQIAQEQGDEAIEKAIIKWRNWFLSANFTKDVPPF